MIKIFYLALFTIFFSKTSIAEIFVSSSKFIVEVPLGFKAIEKDYMGSPIVIMFNPKSKEPNKSMITVQMYDEQASTTFRSVVKQFPDVKIGDEFCNGMKDNFQSQSPDPSKNINLYECRRESALSKMRFKNGLKFVYDTNFDNHRMHQYTFELKDKFFNVAGVCEKSKCLKMDEKYLDIALDIKY